MRIMEFLTAAMFTCITAMLFAILVDTTFASRVEVGDGVINSKSYTPSSTSTGVGFASTGSGGAPVVTTSHSPESFVLIVESGGKLFPVKVDPIVRLNLGVGDSVVLSQRQGRFFRGHFEIGDKK